MNLMNVPVKAEEDPRLKFILKISSRLPIDKQICQLVAS